MPSQYENKLERILKEFPEFVFIPEHRFHEPAKGEKKRRWRFDYACLDLKIALEVEGGIWVGGRHVSPVGFINDCEKYNYATSKNWRVYRLVPTMITKEYINSILNVGT